ncbi:PTS fructose transporter subunit IIC [Enterococcus ureasiticus]|uniref:PTS lactose transporter subunit IIBC n=1 Tax=Enterococcus ureasiticus TaxID=903984 RepID=A0A1E5GA15_9ENTE|nr:PTS fructose transporter subunit IIC [Enterococcus ureasiticus]OEG09548.1 PTS lactose transporter subunit IIBC [Enterococcus ureasiticus]
MTIKKLGREMLNHFQSGVSYMIPLVTAAGLLTSIAVVCGGTEVWDQTDTLWGVIRMIGQTGLQFIVPMIAGYIAYSIADRPGLAPAFICGMIANQMGTGFIGGMFAGLTVGYLVNALKKIPVPTQIISLKSLIIIPFVATLVVGLVLWYVIGTPITAATEALTAWLNGMSGTNAALLGAILGGMMAFDMGGPVNKIAYAFGVASFTSGGYAASTAMLLAIAIPPFGMFLATLLNKKLYTESERDNGKTAIIMGAVGITEGTIPFAVADPLRVIPSIVVGTAIGCAINGAFGVTQETMLATFMAIPFTSNPILYCAAILIGGLVTAIMVNALKMLKYKKQAKTEESVG